MDPSPARFPRRRTLPHQAPSWVNDGAIYFVTICCASRGTNQLCHPVVADAIWESIEFRQQRGDWFVELWLLMPDHLHAVVAFPAERDLMKVIANWKEVIAKKTGITWQRDFFDHRLRDVNGHQEKANYILQNPVRKGLVARPEEWEFIWPPK